jgi:hypothetical protein
LICDCGMQYTDAAKHTLIYELSQWISAFHRTTLSD